MEWANPWFFALLLVIPLYLLLAWKLPKRGIPLGVTPSEKFKEGSLGILLSFLGDWLLLASFLCLVLAMARPREGVEFNQVFDEGIAIEVVIDRSGSMGNDVRGTQLNRLDTVKELFQWFLLGDGDQLKGRRGDMIGLISFAKYPDTHAPLTLSHSVLVDFLDHLTLEDRDEMNKTAIGDAIMLAAARLRWLDQQDDGYEIQSKVILLFTDGEQNAGEYSPITAAEKARDWGIKIYTVGIQGQGLFNQLAGMPGRNTLEQVSQITGGESYIVSDYRDLQEVYQAIDKLEPAITENLEYSQYQEQNSKYLWASFFLLILSFLAQWFCGRRILL